MTSTVEISDNAITISGERKQEHVEENGSVYRFERTYGAFYREIPLPEGAIADQAKAAFKDGVPRSLCLRRPSRCRVDAGSRFRASSVRL